MKRLIALLLTLVMTLSLAACGAKDAPKDADTGKKNDSSQSQTESKPAPEKVEVKIPEGYGRYVNQGAAILYPTDTYKESMMGGVEKTDGGIPWVRISISGDAFDKQKALCEQEHGTASDYSLSEITVGEHKALKCIYSDSAAYFMEVIIDTAFINDSSWACVAIKVEVAKSSGMDASAFDDEGLWEIINSFYFDGSLKYSF